MILQVHDDPCRGCVDHGPRHWGSQEVRTTTTPYHDTTPHLDATRFLHLHNSRHLLHRKSDLNHGRSSVRLRHNPLIVVAPLQHDGDEANSTRTANIADMHGSNFHRSAQASSLLVSPPSSSCLYFSSTASTGYCLSRCTTICRCTMKVLLSPTLRYKLVLPSTHCRNAC
jgi:hypothetical protein